MEIRNQLVHAHQTLIDLQLYQAAKWAAEALTGLELTPEERSQPIIPTVSSHDLNAPDHDKLLLARSYFTCKEFDRAANVLSLCKGPQATFLRLYSTLLACDKRNTTATPEGTQKVTSNQNDSTTVVFLKILDEVAALQNHLESVNDPFLNYLSGIVYTRRKKYPLAQAVLTESVVAFPCNWLAWQELAATLSTIEEANSLFKRLSLKFLQGTKTAPLLLLLKFMLDFFEIMIQQQFYQPLQTISTQLINLELLFPNFHFLKVQKFLFAYHQLDYFQAEAIFDELLKQDPLRLDDLDTYSNMLYVMEKKSKLAFLAQFASLIDKFRPETCFIIANYHLMKGEHEKAITYYRRALTLNQNCLSAWTLMGHEFVELKNLHAAIELYRRAVDINPRDFRAWYGLGQAYEVLDMHMYALYYYQRATSLQPLDKRMWQALGGCYEQVGKLKEAVKSFERALIIDGYPAAGGATSGTNDTNEEVLVEPHIAYRLAILSEKLGVARDTIRYMKMCLDLEREWGIGDETSKARLWLARHALLQRRFGDAYGLVKDLHHLLAHDIEEARLIAREARNRLMK